MRALDITRVGIHKLTPSQVAELSQTQIQQLDQRDFRRLNADQLVLHAGRSIGRNSPARDASASDSVEWNDVKVLASRDKAGAGEAG